MPEVNAPESAGTVMRIDQHQRQQQPRRLVGKHADQQRHQRRKRTSRPVMARWRPNLSASSLPRMLAGMASSGEHDADDDGRQDRRV